MRKILTNQSGEGYINTAVKIIIAVVLGVAILGGFYALYQNVILPKTNTQIESMMNTGTEIQLRKGTKSVEYSYDGENWKTCTIAGIDSTATATNLMTVGSGESTVYLATYQKSTGGTLYSSRNGVDWVPVNSDATRISISKSGSYIYINCDDGRQYKSTDGITWQMTSTKRY